MIIDPSITEKIRGMCGYIKDDAFIAQYLGVSEKQVKRTRGRLPTKRHAAGAIRKPVVGESGNDVRHAHEQAAEIGSRNLLKALVRYAQTHCPEKPLARLEV